MGKPKGQSRGLRYLQKVRPEAMEHLLKFFAASARHLDPKTRFLISVVTKVINFSPRGLEQYVKRALAEGASPAEVIDAVLCAYPCAGLTRVVDAIDVILDLRLPGFEEAGESEGREEVPPGRRRRPPEPRRVELEPGALRVSSTGWVEVARLEEIPEGGRLRVVGAGWDVALFRAGGELFACDNTCPHEGGPLSAGYVEDGRVTCPFHLWRFDLRTGTCVSEPGSSVRVHPVRADATGRVLLALRNPEEA